MILIKFVKNCDLKGHKPPGQYLVTNDGWTGEELMHILDFAEQYSLGCWDELPKTIINRTPTGKLLFLFF